MAKTLNKDYVKRYVSDLLSKDYCITDEQVIIEFSDIVSNYAEEQNLTNYKSVQCYIDGLLTPIDTEIFGCLID